MAALVVTMVVATSGITTLAAPATDNFHAKITGYKSFTLRYGFGDPQGLGQVGVAPYQLSLDQSLAVDVTADALSILTLKGHFNDQEPASMQSLTLYLHSGNFNGVAGDFSLSGKEAFAVYNKKLKGIRLDYTLPGGGKVTGVLSQIEGISESKTFIGHSAHGEVLFSSTVPNQPWVAQPYAKNLAGLDYYALTAPYIAGFSEVNLEFAATTALRTFLDGYGLGYLADTIAATPTTALSNGMFTIVHDKSDFLVLMQSPDSIVRMQIMDYIKAYNTSANLTGKDKKKYPFNTGSAYEIAFLHALAKFIAITVDKASYPLSTGKQHRFYYLGHQNVKPGSIAVEVSVGGGTFQPITTPDLAATYHMTAFPDQGIIEVDFPPAFFAADKSAMRVTYSYSVSGNAYPLGLSVVPGSDKVYLNGKLLTRNTDYTIDYQVGLLILLRKVTDNDTIRIDYERARGGLGSTAEYARNFYGAIVSVPVSDALSFEASLLQAADSPTARVGMAQARTMPNTHTVSGIVGHVTLPGFNANFTLGYNTNQFPLDDNERTNLPNAVTAIATVSGYTFFGNANGVSVYHAGEWSAYTAADGLAGNRVYAIAGADDHVLFGTDAGLTVVSLAGTAPLAQVANWHRYTTADGLPNAAVHALAVSGNTVWIGTAAGIVSVPISKLADPQSWRKYTDAAVIAAGTITALAVTDTQVYVGADHGLFVLDPATGTLTPLPGMKDVRVTAVAVHDGAVYAACAIGLRSFYRDSGTGWITFGKPVHTVAMVGNTIWYGMDSGLYRAGTATPLVTTPVTAIAPDPAGGVWVGTRADADYHLSVFHVQAGAVSTFADTITHISGRDPDRFADIPADTHTDRGGIVRADFTRTLGPITLSGTFERISPKFTAIGRLSRQDITGWTLTARGNPAAGLTLSATHAYHLIDLSTDHPKRTLQDGASLTWGFGPDLSVSIDHSLVDNDRAHPGFDSGKLTYSFGLSDKLFLDTVTAAVSWNDGFVWNFATSLPPQRDTRLSLSGTWRVLSGLTLTGTWTRPVRFTAGARSGTNTWTGTLTWSHQLTTVGLSANYNLTAHCPVGGTRVDYEQSGKFQARLRQFTISAWKVLPVVTATAKEKAGVLTVSGQENVSFTYTAFTASETYTHTVTGLGTNHTKLTDQASINLSYTGIPDLRPSLGYTINRTAVVYMGEARTTINHSLTGRLSYRSAAGVTNDLSLSIRANSGRGRNTLSADLRNTFVYPLEQKISARVVLTGRYMSSGPHPQLNLQLRTGTDVTLTDTWSGSLSASYLTGLKPTGGLYNSLLLELTVTATF